jgi:hypothetical protein
MVIVMAAAAAAAAGLSVAKIRDRTVSLALLDPEGFRIFWVLKVFVSFGSRRFSYLLDPEGFRIFWVVKVFVSFGSRRFSYLLDPEGFRIFWIKRQRSLKLHVDPF